MVNESGKNTRALILHMLREARKPLSGEEMAQSLGISRVAVWKHIKALGDGGYALESSAQGYVLLKDNPDSLDPLAFPHLGGAYRHLQTTVSTMDAALGEALEGAPDGYLITAESQSAGRGMGSKPWISPQGGLFFTIITRPNLHPQYAHRMVIAAQCAMVQAIRNTAGIQATVSWPNDIVCQGKLGGVLGEYLASGPQLSFLNLGIGINTGGIPPVRGSAGIQAGRTALLSAFIEAFKKTQGLGLEGGDSLISLWTSLGGETGQSLRWKETGHEEIHQGVCAGIDPMGNIILNDRSFPPGSIVNLDKTR
jgi:BirA family biotin operon repressor/biotin-[acetyl-CoA-carboxylase] ligase